MATMLKENRKELENAFAQARLEVNGLQGYSERTVAPACREGPQSAITAAAAAELRKGAESLLLSRDDRMKWYGQQTMAALDRGDDRMAFFAMYIMSIDANGYLSPQGQKYADAIIGKGDAAALAGLGSELTKANATYQLVKLGEEIAALREQAAQLDDISRKWADSRLTILEQRRAALVDWVGTVKEAEELARAKGKLPSFLDEYAAVLSEVDKERRVASLSSVISGQITLNNAYARMITGNESALDELKNSTAQLENAAFRLQMGDAASAQKAFNQAIDMKAGALIDYAPAEGLSPLAAMTREKERWQQLSRYVDDQKRVFSDILSGQSISDMGYYQKLQDILKGSYLVEYSIFGVPSSFAYAKAQGSIRNAVKNGMLDEAAEGLQKLIAEVKTREFAAKATLMVGGAAAFFIPVAGPWISGTIFVGIAADSAINEYRMKGSVSPQSWVAIGLNAIPFLGPIKALRVPLVVAGAGGLGWMGVNVYDLYSRAAKATDPYERSEYLREAVLGTGMMFFPLAVGGPKFVKGVGEAVPAAISRAQEAFANTLDMLRAPEARLAYQARILTGPEAMDLMFRPRVTGKKDMDAVNRKAGLKERATAAVEGFKKGKAREEPAQKSEEEIAREKAAAETQRARETQESDFLKTARQGLIGILEAGNASSLAGVMKALYARASEKGCPRNVQEQCYQEMGRLASYEKARAGMVELAKKDAVLGQALRRADIAIREGAGKSQLEVGQFMRSQAREGPGEEGVAFIVETIERPTAQRNARLIMEFTELQSTRIPKLEAEYAKTHGEAARAALDKATNEMNAKYAQVYAPESRPFALSESILGIAFNAVQKAAMLRRFMQHELTTKLTAKKPGQTSGIFHKSAILAEAEANPEIAAQLTEIIGETTSGARQRVGMAGTEFGTVKSGLQGWIANSFPVKLAKGGWGVFKWAEWNSLAKGRKILEETPAEKTAMRASGYAWMAWQGVIWGGELYVLGFGGQRIGPFTTPGFGLVPTALNVFTHEKDVKAATLRIERDYGVTVKLDPDNAKFLMSEEAKNFYSSIPGNYPSPQTTRPALESSLAAMLADKRVYLDPTRLNEAVADVRAWKAKNGKVPTFKDMEAAWLASGVAARMPQIVAEDFLRNCRVEVVKDDPRAKYLVAHPDEFTSLWNAVQRGNIPMVYAGSAIDELMRGRSFDDLPSAGYYIQIPVQNGFSGIRYKSLLGTLDAQAFYDPEMAPVVRSVLDRYKNNASAMRALNDFEVDAGYVVYGNPAQLAAMIIRSPQTALADAKADGMVAPGTFAAKDPTMVCYTYTDQNGYQSRSYGSAQARFLMKYSEEATAGLRKWVSDNDQHIRNGVTEKGKGYLRMIVEDLEATMPAGLDAEGAYQFANQRATAYKERGYWVGITPREIDDAKARRKIPSKMRAPLPARLETENFTAGSEAGLKKVEVSQEEKKFYADFPKVSNAVDDIISELRPSASAGEKAKLRTEVHRYLNGANETNDNELKAANLKDTKGNLALWDRDGEVKRQLKEIIRNRLRAKMR